MEIKEHKDDILNYFACQETGNCCKTSGYVYANDLECDQMAKSLGISPSEFRQKYVRKDRGWSLVAATDFRESCFLDECGKCRVYEARPKQCRTYPNWPEIWDSVERFHEETKSCKGLELAYKTFLKHKKPTSE